METITEIPKCKKCGNPAMGMLAGVWLCGEHIEKLGEMFNKQRDKMLEDLE